MMNILFIHPNFPGQFGFLAELLGRDKANKTLFITSANTPQDRQIPGVQKIVFSDPSANGEKKVQISQNSPGLSVAHLLAGLKKQNYTPDLIIGYSGPATCLYVKDLFPKTPFLGFFDWFHNPGKPHDPLNAAASPPLQVRMNLRNQNLSILSDLCACDHGICPTDWQKSQFPPEFYPKLGVIPEPINTQLFVPVSDQKFKTHNLDLSHVKQLITYTANVLAPYPGFQQFMESIPMVWEQKPDAHVVIVGADRVSVQENSGQPQSYKSLILKKVELNPEQVHFMDALNHEDYIKALQTSSVHVYLDAPLVVSRSLLNAMSCGCLVVAPDLLPVRETITDGSNGILVDFSTPEKIAEKIIACLDYPSFMKTVKQKAREAIKEKHAIEKIVPQLLTLVQKLAKKNRPSTPFG